MSENYDILLHEARQCFTSPTEHCNVCEHNVSKLERCGHVIQKCHHPKLDANADDGWPEVDGTMICDWFEKKEHRR